MLPSWAPTLSQDRGWGFPGGSCPLGSPRRLACPHRERESRHSSRPRARATRQHLAVALAAWRDSLTQADEGGEAEEATRAHAAEQQGSDFGPFELEHKRR